MDTHAYRWTPGRGRALEVLVHLRAPHLEPSEEPLPRARAEQKDPHEAREVHAGCGAHVPGHQRPAGAAVASRRGYAAFSSPCKALG